MGPTRSTAWPRLSGRRHASAQPRRALDAYLILIFAFDMLEPRCRCITRSHESARAANEHSKDLHLACLDNAHEALTWGRRASLPGGCYGSFILSSRLCGRT